MNEPISTANIVAAILSLIIPGAGQIIQGRVVRGIVQFILAALLWFVFIGWVIHLFSVVDALLYQKTPIK